MGGVEEVGEVRGGRRKGREPVGEAWFVEGRVRKGTLARRRRVCEGDVRIRGSGGGRGGFGTYLPLETARVEARQA
jgi:hypothetical protein